MRISLHILITSLVIMTNAIAQQKPAFKGLELYYWSDNPTKEFKFCLLSGTNRNKTDKDILSTPALEFNSLKEQLENLPEGEHLFLYSKLRQTNTNLFFKKPDNNILQTIELIANKRNFKFTLIDESKPIQFQIDLQSSFYTQTSISS